MGETAPHQKGRSGRGATAHPQNNAKTESISSSSMKAAWKTTSGVCFQIPQKGVHNRSPCLEIGQSRLLCVSVQKLEHTKTLALTRAIFWTGPMPSTQQYSIVGVGATSLETGAEEDKSREIECNQKLEETKMHEVFP